jgi:acyl-CoA synthetase (NDP forming)
LKRLGGVMLQEQVSGVELILGVKKDPVFNHVLLLGLGGVLVELIKDVSLRVCPVTKSEAESMIRELKTYPLLTGYRGKKGINLDLLARLLVDLSKTAIKNDIKALDINPLIAKIKNY